MNQPIFRNTSQAIAFSYLMAQLPAKEGGALGKMLDRMKLEATGVLEARELSSISFAGLSDMEIRAQCAMVRYAVESLLPPPESWAIRARMGGADIQRGPGGHIVRANFTPARIKVLRQLAAYVGPSHPTLGVDAVMLVLARICGDCDQLRPTFRRIEEEAGSSKSALERAEKGMKKRIRELVNLGVDRLTPGFVRDGLVMAE